MGIVYLALDPVGRAVALKRCAPASRPTARPAAAVPGGGDAAPGPAPAGGEVLDADVDASGPIWSPGSCPGCRWTATSAGSAHWPRSRWPTSAGSWPARWARSTAAGIVHRDVKPANVVLLDGDPVLIDFGIAHLADESRITMTGLVMGTPDTCPRGRGRAGADSGRRLVGLGRLSPRTSSTQRSPTQHSSYTTPASIKTAPPAVREYTLYRAVRRRDTRARAHTPLNQL